MTSSCWNSCWFVSVFDARRNALYFHISQIICDSCNSCPLCWGKWYSNKVTSHERHVVLNHQRFCLFNRSFMQITKETPTLCNIPLCKANLPVAGSWWRHQMETFSALLAICAPNSPGPVNSPHKGQWRGALTFSLICVWINGWVNNHEAGDLRRYRVHYDVTIMYRTKGQ